jgi:transcriptional regulator GlxA family with amidase domain
MLRSVALLAIPGVAPFEFGVVCEIFGIDRSSSGGPAFDFTIVTADPGPVETSLGFTMMIENGLDAAANADLLARPKRAVLGYSVSAAERSRSPKRASCADAARRLTGCTPTSLLAGTPTLR